MQYTKKKIHYDRMVYMPPHITVTTTIAAPLEKVWEYWTTPEHVTGWNFASPDWECPQAENDLRPGGTFSYRMAAKDGSAAFDFAGTYIEVAPLSRIAYEFGGRTATVDFTTTPNGVTVIQTFDPEEENPLDLQRDGWQAILDNFKRYVETYK
jgi:uncharacterized protein YndB with AHSA1/START domain